MKEDIQHS